MASILMVASEGLPFIKSGGLADVIGSLPKGLHDLGHDVRVIMPLYQAIAKKYKKDFQMIRQFTVSIAFHEVLVNLYEYSYQDILFYFIEHKDYFERENLYGYVDDGERFAYFQKAVVEMLNQLDYFPQIMHAHDWHAGMLGAICKEGHGFDERYRRIKHVFTIHNLAFQGNFGVAMLDSCLGLDYRLFDNGNVRFDTGISFMKSGILYADKVSTVSPSYANEIMSSEFGERMEMVLNLRRQDVWGILNGIDTVYWNPKTDPAIPNPFNKVNVHKNKALNKVALQKELGLKKDKDVMLIGIVSRLTAQKGFYLLLEKLSTICSLPIQLAILGNGEEVLETKLQEAEALNKGKIAFYKGYNEALAHRIYAACDLFLMPSLFEPCGISQLISMRYGTLPLVREIGGLKDSVTPYNKYEKVGNGFSFKEYDATVLIHVLQMAIDLYYHHSKDWRLLMKNAMNTDVSWDKSALLYTEMYESLLK